MTTTYEPNVVLSTKEYDVVGTRPIRHDGVDKVTVPQSTVQISMRQVCSLLKYLEVPTHTLVSNL